MKKVSKPASVTIRIMIHNALQFIYMVIFINIFQFIFGPEHILTTVAMGVGFFMLPGMYTGVKPSAMALMVIGLYTSSALVAQLALVSPWVALPINFLYVIIIFAITCEPAMLQPSISFILCFVFSQSTPVSIQLFPARMLCVLTGGCVVALVIIITWRKNNFGKNGRSFIEQVKLSEKHYNYILRMAAGISIAMFIGMILGVKKPLWISIVVMSLTQIDYKDTLLRIKNRSISTVIGEVLFLFLFGLLIPEKYSIYFILFISYLGNLTSQYRYKQIVNAICALNASLFLLSTPLALINRILCLISGIVIVLVMWKLEKPITLLYEKIHAKYKKSIGAKSAPELHTIALDN